MTAAASRFFALASLVAGGVAVVVFAAVLAGRAGRTSSAPLVALAPSSLSLAWLVAATATTGSLFYSEITGFVPCELCWYQRIAMYPLVVILGIAALRGDTGVRRYAMPLAGAGLALAAYHYWLQWNPDAGITACSSEAPCAAMLVREFGFVSIPFMALSGFACIVALLMATRSSKPPVKENRT